MPRFDEEGDRLGHRLAALQLHRRRAGLLEHARGVAERLLRALLIGAERHVDRDQSVPRTAHHRRAMRAHHLEADRDGRRQAVNHLAEAVADQQEIAMRIEQLRHPHRVGGERDDRLAALARQDRRRGQSLHRRRAGRRAAGRGVDRVGGHGARFSGSLRRIESRGAAFIARTSKPATSCRPRDPLDDRRAGDHPGRARRQRRADMLGRRDAEAEDRRRRAGARAARRASPHGRTALRRRRR